MTSESYKTKLEKLRGRTGFYGRVKAPGLSRGYCFLLICNNIFNK